MRPIFPDSTPDPRASPYMEAPEVDSGVPRAMRYSLPVSAAAIVCLGLLAVWLWGL